MEIKTKNNEANRWKNSSLSIKVLNSGDKMEPLTLNLEDKQTNNSSNASERAILRPLFTGGAEGMKRERRDVCSLS